MEEIQKATIANMPKRKGSLLFTGITPEGATLTGAGDTKGGALFLGKWGENATVNR
jgi:hypothetical protein